MANTAMKLTGFEKNIATLVTGGIASNLITVATIPVISRLFEPEDFGAAALFASMVLILAILATLRYEQAIVLPAAEKDAANLVVLSSLIAIALAIALVIGMALIFVYAPSLPWVQILGGWFLCVPIAVLLTALANIVLGLSTREKKFGRIAVAEVVRVGADAGIKITTGATLGSSLGALNTAYLIASSVRLYVLSKVHWKRLSEFVTEFDKRDSMPLLRRYQQFPRYSMPTGLLRSFGQNIPVFALAAMFSPAVVGFYAMAFKLLSLPGTVIGEAVRRTYLQKAVEISNRGDSLAESMLKITAALLALGLVIFTPLFLWGAELLALLLGEKWADAGQYVAILAPWFLMLFVQLAASVIFIVRQRQDALFRVHLISTTMLVLVFLIAAYYNVSSIHTLMAASAVGTIANLTILFLGYFLARQTPLPAS